MTADPITAPDPVTAPAPPAPAATFRIDAGIDPVRSVGSTGHDERAELRGATPAADSADSADGADGADGGGTDDSGGTDDDTPPPRLAPTSPPRLVALALQAAAVGHVIAALAHLNHGWDVAVFFLVVAAVQLFTAGRLARGGAGTAEVLAVLAGTVGLVLLYVASRTINLPFGGPHVANNDRPQDPDLLGTVVVFAELVALGAAPALLPEPVRRRATTGLLAIGVGMWAAWAFGLV